MPETRRQQHNITSGYIQIVVESDNRIPAYWAHPSIGGSFPGVVLLHDDWGLDATTRSRVNRLAEVGCYVLAPDLFDGHKATDQSTADSLKRIYQETAEPRVDAAMLALETHRKTSGSISVVGWEIGAELAVQSTFKHKEVVATVAFYADLTAMLENLASLHCPLMTIFGGQDKVAKALIPQLKTVLETGAKLNHQVLVYPDVEKRFCNEKASVYNEEAAEDAWEKVLDFLEEHQGMHPAPDDDDNRFFKPGRVY